MSNSAIIKKGSNILLNIPLQISKTCTVTFSNCNGKTVGSECLKTQAYPEKEVTSIWINYAVI